MHTSCTLPVTFLVHAAQYAAQLNFYGAQSELVLVLSLRRLEPIKRDSVTWTLAAESSASVLMLPHCADTDTSRAYSTAPWRRPLQMHTPLIRLKLWPDRILHEVPSSMPSLRYRRRT